MSSTKAVVKPLQLTPLAAALAGALGGCFSSAVVYPLDVAKTRIQALPSDKLGKKSQRSMLAVLLRILKTEGIAGWYRGFAATMLNTFSTQYAYFFFYSFVRGSYIKRLTAKLPPGSKAPVLSTAAELLLGAVAGALAQIFTIPVSVIATRQQVGRVVKPQLKTSEEGELPTPEAPVDESFLTVAKEIIDEQGVTGLWLGLRASLVLTVNPSITYGMFERIKSLMLLAKEKAGASQKLTSGQIFLVGALSKTMATVVTYPYIMAKVRIQARSSDQGANGEDPGAVEILTKVLRNEGLVGWYQGMQAQITKAVLSQALLFWSKEQFEQWAVAIILVLSTMSGRS
ncbi:mitochondrial carrier [Flagelloscypha sp. PMI_526]|nr:mitochondrial carrier [Flagelloscypha sp. PMI_526]